MDGRREARRRRLHFIGTVGVLQTAARSGLLDFREALTRLRGTTFYIAQEMFDRLIQDDET